MNILITSTSFQDTPGSHINLLEKKKWNPLYLRGPLTADILINYKEKINGIICGDDEINKKVLDKWSKDSFYGISKYGIGLDKIDLEYAQKVGIKVKNCKGVNSDTVAEHVFAKILSYSKNLYQHYNNTKQGKWKRFAGFDLKNKKIMIVGYGAIGKRVACLAEAFKMRIIIVDPFVISDKYKINKNISDVIEDVDFLTLHTSLSESTFELINRNSLNGSRLAREIIASIIEKFPHIEEVYIPEKYEIYGKYLKRLLEECGISIIKLKGSTKKINGSKTYLMYYEKFYNI